MLIEDNTTIKYVYPVNKGIACVVVAPHSMINQLAKTS